MNRDDNYLRNKQNNNLTQKIRNPKHKKKIKKYTKRNNSCLSINSSKGNISITNVSVNLKNIEKLKLK